MAFNTVVIVGRLTSDPVLRYASSGSPVCTFSIVASWRTTNEAGEKVEEDVLIEVEVWRRMAEMCAQFLKTNREVLVIGTLRRSRGTDPETRKPRSMLKIVAEQVHFLGPWGKSKGPHLLEDPDGPHE
jgi:single-strand DNA-binding protein